MRSSFVFCLLAMCYIASANATSCWMKMAIPSVPCLLLCQHDNGGTELLLKENGTPVQAYADFEPQCTRKWPIPPFQCLYLCQHEEWRFLRIPRFTVDKKANGTHCRRYVFFNGECYNGRCVRATNEPFAGDITITPEDESA
uniref:Putative 8 2 8.0 kDa secreted protein n=1 Tax=Ixodes ricinus TaxID=34613 RepID=V5H1M3_IXORI